MQKYRQQQNSVILDSAKKRENLDKILYEDAFRRLEENKKKKEDLDRVRDLPKEKPYHNNKSEKFVR